MAQIEYLDGHKGHKMHALILRFFEQGMYPTGIAFLYDTFSIRSAYIQ
jgi:hypothetical protein